MPQTADPRMIATESSDGRFGVFVDDPVGLVYCCTYATFGEAKAMFPNLINIPVLWDAPIFYPSRKDPSCP